MCRVASVAASDTNDGAVGGKFGVNWRLPSYPERRARRISMSEALIAADEGSFKVVDCTVI